MSSNRSVTDKSIRQPRIVIHAGAHKTGISLIQSYLAHHFRRSDCFYLNPEVINASGLLNAVHGIDDQPINFMAVARQAGWNSHQTILISHESLLGFCSLQTAKRDRYFYGALPENAARLKNLLAGWHIDVVYYIRRQDDFIAAIYLELLAAGLTNQDFDTFLSAQDLSQVSWGRVLNDLTDAFGKKHVRFGLFDEIQLGPRYYVAGFLRRAGLNISDEEIPVLREDLPSFSQIAYELAMAAIKLAMPASERILLNHFLRKNFSNRTHEAFDLLTEERREQLMQQCETHNVRMFKTFFPQYANCHWYQSKDFRLSSAESDKPFDQPQIKDKKETAFYFENNIPEAFSGYQYLLGKCNVCGQNTRFFYTEKSFGASSYPANTAEQPAVIGPLLAGYCGQSTRKRTALQPFLPKSSDLPQPFCAFMILSHLFFIVSVRIRFPTCLMQRAGSEWIYRYISQIGLLAKR